MQKEYLFVVLAGILSGTIVFGGQIFINMGLSVYQVAIFCEMLIPFILLPWILSNKKMRPTKEMLSFFIAFGLIGAMIMFMEFVPLLLHVPVAIVVLLLYTQPLWTTLFSKLFFKEKITAYKILAVCLVIIGVVFLVNPFTIKTTGTTLGLLLATLGGIFLSGWVLLGRFAGIKKYHPITTEFGTISFLIFFLLLFQPVLATFLKMSSITNLSFSLPLRIWVYLFIFMFVGRIAPHLFYFMGAKKVPASDSGIILLLEPVSATILAIIFLQQMPTLNVIIGGALILISNYLILRKK